MQFCAVALRHDLPEPGRVPRAASFRFLLVCPGFLVSSLLRTSSDDPQQRSYIPGPFISALVYAASHRLLWILSYIFNVGFSLLACCVPG
jgi:hypothetical protein